MTLNSRTFLIILSLGILPVVGYVVVNPREPVQTLKLNSTELEVKVLVNNLEIPWDMDWSGDGWIWFSEKKGRISRFLPESGPLQLVHVVEDVFQSRVHSGLHALALHPDFPAVPHIFVHYTHSKNTSRLVRFTFNPSSITLEDKTILLDDLLAALTHNESRIAFSADKTELYLTLGDAGRAELAPDLNEYAGKILRLNLDGSIPDDNPFPESHIWSYGHRNPQGLIMAGNNKLYSSEHGSANDDELNLIEKGKNYGHPAVRGFCDTEGEQEYCRSHEVTVPLYTWSPTFGVSGIEYYDHPAIPEWQNSILVTMLKRGSGGIWGTASSASSSEQKWRCCGRSRRLF